MIEVHFLVPSKVVEKLSPLSRLRHKDGVHGYFADLSIEEFWTVVRSLVEGGYRIDVTPGATYKLVSRSV